MPGNVFLNNIMLQSVDLLSSITYQYIIEFKATCTLERIRMLAEVTQKNIQMIQFVFDASHFALLTSTSPNLSQHKLLSVDTYCTTDDTLV